MGEAHDRLRQILDAQTADFEESCERGTMVFVQAYVAACGLVARELEAENAWLRQHLALALKLGGEECEKLRASVQFWRIAAESKCRCCVSSAINSAIDDP